MKQSLSFIVAYEVQTLAMLELSDTEPYSILLNISAIELDTGWSVVPAIAKQTTGKERQLHHGVILQHCAGPYLKGGTSPEDGDDMFLLNAGIYLQIHVALQSRTTLTGVYRFKHIMKCLQWHETVCSSDKT